MKSTFTLTLQQPIAEALYVLLLDSFNQWKKISKTGVNDLVLAASVYHASEVKKIAHKLHKALFTSSSPTISIRLKLSEQLILYTLLTTHHIDQPLSADADLIHFVRIIDQKLTDNTPIKNALA